MRILVWSWKRQGGGLRCGFEMARAFGQIPGVEAGVYTFGHNRLSGLFSEVSVSFKEESFGSTNALGTGFYLPRLRRDLARTLRRFEPDVVISPMECVWHAFASDVLAVHKIPYVGLIHEPSVRQGNGLSAGVLGWWLFQLDRSRYTRVVCLSDYVAKSLERLGEDRGRIWSRVHPVFESFPAAVDRAPDLDRPQLLFFGRINKSKGLDLLMDSFALVRNRLPHAELRIVGNGGGQNALLSQQEGLTVERGFVAENSISGMMRAADLVVLPYRSATQSGVAAWATGAGVPCVATPVGALPEQVMNGINGVVSQAVSAPAFAVAILDAISSRERYQQLRAGASSVGQRLSWTRFCTELLEEVIFPARSGR